MDVTGDGTPEGTGAADGGATMATTNGQAEQPTTAHDDLVAALRVGVMRLSRRLQLEREADDLSLTQLAVLGTLRRDGPLTIGELAGIERVKPPSMTRAVNLLEQAGLVTRCAHATDGRHVVVKLTDRARSVLREHRRRRDEWLSAHLRGLTAADRAVLARAVPVLERLASS
jgi:DNA-binding MarR family transcriptional regulator